jgi:hypothetical protein
MRKSSDNKRTMHERVFEQLGRNPEVSPEDILSWVVETAAGAPSHT